MTLRHWGLIERLCTRTGVLNTGNCGFEIPSAKDAATAGNKVLFSTAEVRARSIAAILINTGTVLYARSKNSPVLAVLEARCLLCDRVAQFTADLRYAGLPFGLARKAGVGQRASGGSFHHSPGSHGLIGAAG
ncbi:hypothetical protein MPH_01062 [Macrophomina phaseolina MS6]|uniref:Uncharacterized protein n=1 Tax=Macrophomina phaseolina (strain MS6) TaxID=1126212 RepID=K2S3Y2_MACPH|nr:hypothetical protein MPH_01062 [Macrophomina phaseolina MS6]